MPPDPQCEALYMNRRFKTAYDRINPHIQTTRCPKSKLLSEELDADIFLKLENEQVTGSFKIRGVTNKILSLTEEDRGNLLVAASSGNHGAAFGHIVSKLNLQGKLFVPENIKEVKRKALEETGIPITFLGTDCLEAELAAAKYCAEQTGVFVGPYNDLDVIAGQGTIAIDLIEQLGNFDFVFVPLGGGGLISGIASYLKSIDAKTKVIGCQPKHSPVMLESIRAGHIVTMESLPTLADATAGGIEPDAITFDLCRTLVDDFVVLTEKEIFFALKFLHCQEHVVAEGGSAMTVAAVRQYSDRVKGKRVALVISGGKIDESIIKELENSDD